MNGTVTEFKEKIVTWLKEIFGRNQVKPEWDVAENSRDDLSRDLYCPRIDIAVGPFNIHRNVVRDREIINNAYLQHRYFIDKLNAIGDRAISDEHLNKNPRCLLAIEVENRGSRKHRLGSIVNAAAIGKVGLLVAFTAESYNSLRKIREYLQFITDVRKVEEDISKNVIIISKDDFSRILEDCARGP